MPWISRGVRLGFQARRESADSAFTHNTPGPTYSARHATDSPNPAHALHPAHAIDPSNTHFVPFSESEFKRGLQ